MVSTSAKLLFALLSLSAAPKGKPEGAPYSAETFKKAYQDFILHPPKVKGGLLDDPGAYFHDADTLQDVRKSAKAESIFMDPRYAPDKSLTDKAIRASVDDPVLLSGMLRQTWNIDRSLLFRGDVYADSYFHEFAEQKKIFRSKAPRLETWDKLVRSQPWLEWNAEKEKFRFRSAGAGERLLSFLGEPDETITLYRGTGVGEARLFSIASKAAGRPLDSAEISELHGIVRQWRGALDPSIQALSQKLAALEDGKKSSSKEESAELLRSAVETYQLTQLASSYGQAFFMSPDEGVAHFFQNFYENRESTTVSYTFKIRDLQKLAADRKIYVGLERGGMELAFFHPDAVDALVAAFAAHE